MTDKTDKGNKANNNKANKKSRAKTPGQDGSRARLIKAAEDIMRENGYAAVTSRRVAARAELKPQLVHYYFRNMDELFLEVYRHWADHLVNRLNAVLESKRPLKEMWKATTDARGVLLNEFIALANHRKELQDEIAEFGNRYRRHQIRIMEAILAKNVSDNTVSENNASGNNASHNNTASDNPAWTPAFAAILLNALARALASESEVGITEGHEDALATVEYYMQKFGG